MTGDEAMRLTGGSFAKAALVAARRGFHGLSHSQVGESSKEVSDVVIVGIPLDSGTSERPGTRVAPDAIRQATYWSGEVFHVDGQTEVFRYLAVTDIGNVTIGFQSHQRSISEVQGALADVAHNARCIVALGGDHSALYPTLALEHQTYGPITLIHFGARANLSQGSVITPSTVVRAVVENGWAEHTFQLGLRGGQAGRGDLSWAKEMGVKHWTVQDIRQSGLEEIVDLIVERSSSKVHLSVDIGVLDPAFAPGTSYPEPGGLATRELLPVIRHLATKLDVIGMDVVEVAPPYDHSDITAAAANRCVMELLVGKAKRSSPRR